MHALYTQANMGVSVKFLDPAEQAAAAVAAQQTLGHFRDAQAITEFAAGCDVLTVEIEHINADAMESAGKASGVDVEPTPSTLRIIQVGAAAGDTECADMCWHACELHLAGCCC
jgi:phosphoribosylaminoimidazole carboxylase (NCAIR synthetase)